MGLAGVTAGAGQPAVRSADEKTGTETHVSLSSPLPW
jgi:hypothetical protein